MNAKMMAALLGLTVLAVAAGASAGVYDDVKAWYHLDYADSGTPAPADIRDQRQWGYSSYHATGAHGSRSWTTIAEDFGPAGGRTFGGRALELDASTGSAGFEVNNLSVAGDATLFMRVKWDGSIHHGGAAAAYFNGFGWSADKGWMLRFVGSGDPQLYYGKSKATAAGWTTTADTWYDLAVVLDDNGANDTITFYRTERTGDEFDGKFQQVTRNVNWFAGEVNSSVTRVGYEATNYKYFGGEIESIGIWDRALSTDEVRGVFGYPDPAWTIGADNGTSHDMRKEWETDADYTLGDPWHTMRRAVTSGTHTANVHFALNAEEAALNRVFHLEVDGVGSGGGSVRVEVNGVPRGTVTTTGGEDFVWFVPAALVQQGSNTLSIRHAGGSYVAWDWMELGGSWQIGTDNNSYGDFAAEWDAGEDFYVTDRNWKHLRRAITASASRIKLHFDLSEELAEYSYVFSFETLGQSGHPFDVLLNGTVLGTYTSQYGQAFDIPIPWQSYLMTSGENVITMQYQDSSGYMGWDWLRLEIQNNRIPEPGTLSLLGLGGLALLRRRRRR